MQRKIISSIPVYGDIYWITNYFSIIEDELIALNLALLSIYYSLIKALKYNILNIVT